VTTRQEATPGPSRVWYWVGGGAALIGVTGAVLWFVLGLLSLSHQVEGFQRVPIDGEPRRVNLLRAGSYTAYFEPRFGRASDSGPAVDARLVAPDGQEVPLSSYDSDLTYDFGGYQGRAVFTFRIDSPGAYQLQSSAADGGVLALGRGVGNKLVTSIVGAFAIGIVGLAVGIPLVIVTAVRRHSARRRDAPPRYTAPYPPPPPPPPAPGTGPPPHPSAGASS